MTYTLFIFHHGLQLATVLLFCLKIKFYLKIVRYGFKSSKLINISDKKKYLKISNKKPNLHNAKANIKVTTF